jgi:hypothetical protein
MLSYLKNFFSLRNEIIGYKGVFLTDLYFLSIILSYYSVINLPNFKLSSVSSDSDFVLNNLIMEYFIN